VLRKLPQLWIRRILRFAVAALVVLLILHRTPNHAFRTARADCDSPEACRAIERVGDATLAFVEIDDQGEYFDQRQAIDAFRLIREAPSQPSLGVDVFVFVHGWQHNANPNDAHVQQFRTFLERTAARLPRRRTVGVYVSWPGETLRWPLSGLTFWSRKAAAHRVASGVIQEFFATLQQVKQDAQRHAETNPDVEVPKVYVIGHSFGGLIAFQANSRSLALRYGNDVLVNRRGAMAEGLGDLVVLINPAIEAIRFSSLRALAEEFPGASFKLPVLATVSSESDTATRFLFPSGVLAGTLITNQVRSGQWLNVLTTVGNSRSLRTHRAFIDDRGELVVCEESRTNDPRLPFWFISAASSVLNGHGDLNGEKLLSLFARIQRGFPPSCADLK
jgi:pimeloyl-ACP methyl ester carboxylesterase